MNDLISRQAVLGYIDRVLTIGTGKKKSLDFVRKYIETLPSAELETHGKTHGNARVRLHQPSVGDCSRRAVKSVWARGHDGVGQ